MVELKIPKGLSAAVLHTHTTYTDGMVSAQDLVLAAARARLSVLAITDHDTLLPIDEVQKAGREFGVEVIAGQEIQTSLPRGLHVVGLFLKRPIPHSKPISWTIAKIREQGGIAVVAHPLVRLFNCVKAPTGAFQERDLKKLIQSCGADAIELRHRFLHKVDEAQLDNLYYNNQKHLGAIIGASDSHFGEKDMFSHLTLFPGLSAKDLYTSIKDKTTKVGCGPKAKISSSELLFQLKKSLITLGLRRYSKMLSRWSLLKFGDVTDYLD